jgi:RNA polymerase sigma-70 factor (ECF subfamily)
MKQIKQPFNCQFEETTFCYMEQLFRLAYSRIGNTQDAEDIVQETYLKAYRAYGGLRQRESIKSWLTRILLNTVRDYQRKGMRSVSTVDISDMEEDSVHEPSQIGPEEQLCRDEIDPSLFKALQAIPVTFLTPLLLREIYGATYDEIADTLDIPVGTVMSRLFRARCLLRNALLPELSSDNPHAFPRATEEKRKRGSSQ